MARDVSRLRAWVGCSVGVLLALASLVGVPRPAAGGATPRPRPDQEDFGMVATLERLSSVGKVDRNRVLVLRGASNFDQPPPGGSSAESIQTTAENGGYRLAVENVFRVGTVFVQDVVDTWPRRREALDRPGHRR